MKNRTVQTVIVKLISIGIIVVLLGSGSENTELNFNNINVKAHYLLKVAWFLIPIFYYEILVLFGNYIIKKLFINENDIKY